MKKLMLLLMLASPVFADTAITLYSQGTTNYLQVWPSTGMSFNYQLFMPIGPGALNQVLSINKVNTSSITTTWVTQSGGGGGGVTVYPASATASFPFGFSASTEAVTSSFTLTGPFLANGSVGSLGQVLVSNGPGSAPTFVDPVVSQATDSNLNASVSIKGSSNAVSVPLGIQLASSTLNVNVPTAIQLASSTLNVSMTSGIQLASSTIVVVQSSNGVNASTINVVQPASVPNFRIDLTTTVVVHDFQGIQLASSTLTVLTPLGIQLASTTLNVNVPAGIQLASTTLVVIQSSNGVNASTINVVQPASVPNFRIDLTTTVVVHDFQGIQLASNTITVLTPLGIQLASSTLNVSVPLGVQLASTTLTVVTSSSGVNASTVAASQQGVWTVNPGTGTYPVVMLNSISVTLSSSGVNASTVAVSQQGIWTVNPGTGTYNVNIVGGGGSGGTSSNFTAAFPSAGTAAGWVNSNGNMQGAGVTNSSAAIVYVVNNSTVSIPLAVQLASGTPANPFTVSLPLAVQLSSGTPANPFTVNIPLAIQLASSTLNVSQANGAVVVLSSNGVNASTVNVVQLPGSPSFKVDYSTTLVVHDFQAIQLASGTAANPFTVSVPLSIQLTSGTPANPFYVLSPLSQQLSSGTPTNPFYAIIAASATVTGAKADNGVAAGTDRVPTVPSIYQSNYLAGTAATVGRNGALSQGTDGLLWTASLPSLRPADYHASSATQVAATATDIAQICGQGTTATLLTQIRVSCTQTTAGNVHLSILKRSNADQPGAAAGNIVSTMTVVPSNSNFSANSTTATYVYTGNPTRGGLVGQLDSYNIGCMAAATATPNDIYISPAWWRTKPIVLNGIKECVDVSLANGVDGNGTTVTGGVFNINFDWIETTAITP